jgi:hypothetical protein
MKHSLLLFAIASSISTLPALAEQNPYELKQVKAGKITAIKSSQGINLLTEKNYDKYIISVSGDGGFSQQYESDYPSLKMVDLELPYNGSYSYEIKSIKYAADIKDTMNNGRSEEAVGKVSIVDVKSGMFTNNYGEMVTRQSISEPQRTLSSVKTQEK